jgi:hypothetical protein
MADFVWVWTGGIGVRWGGPNAWNEKCVCRLRG